MTEPAWLRTHTTEDGGEFWVGGGLGVVNIPASLLRILRARDVLHLAIRKDAAMADDLDDAGLDAAIRAAEYTRGTTAEMVERAVRAYLRVVNRAEQLKIIEERVGNGLDVTSGQGQFLLGELQSLEDRLRLQGLAN